MRCPTQERPDETGSAVVEFIWVGILVLIPMVWIVISVFEVQRGAFGTSAAARSAARAFALAPNDAIGAARARDAARRALADQGLGDAPMDVQVTCTPFPRNCHSGTSVITVRIDSRVDLPLMPQILSGAQSGFTLDATHVVPIGQYQEIEP